MLPCIVSLILWEVGMYDLVHLKSFNLRFVLSLPNIYIYMCVCVCVCVQY
jgi:hypothetical protein